MTTVTDAGPALDLPERPVFKPDLTVKVIAGDGVLVHGESESRLFTGAVYEALAPLLDGKSTSDELIDALSEAHPYMDLYFALFMLASRGVVVDASIARQPNADFVLARALGALGVQQVRDGEVTLVVAESYLDHGLRQVNERQLGSGEPWLLCAAHGSVVWVGPLFIPGQTSCWECLQHRLARNRPVDTLLLSSQPGEQPVTTRRLHTDNMQGLRDLLCVINADTLTRDDHRVTRRPQCRACGDPSLYALQLDRAPSLQHRPKRHTSDGGHRASTPNEIVERLEPLVDPLTGVVTSLERVETGFPALHVYTAGINVARPAADVAGLRASLRRNTGGKGLSDIQARASALGEGVERYCGLFHGDEPRVRATFQELGDSALHPNTCMLFSETQLSDRGGTAVAARDPVPVPFPVDEACGWTPVWSMTANRVRYLPTSLLYYGYGKRDAVRTTIADSNGNAAGTSLEDAILQGFLELIERDAAAIWWYNRVRRPAIDLASIDSAEWCAALAAYKEMGREVWLLDLSTDFAIPAVAALSRKTQGAEEILVGLGAHFDARIAAQRALTEMSQMLVALGAVRRDAGLDPTLAGWLNDATVQQHAYLLPNELPARNVEQRSLATHDDLEADVRMCQRLVEHRGLELLVLDQTRPDVQVPVVKVIVPGLRHFRQRFAQGRLYDIPVQCGWRGAPNAETDLNPIPFFL